MKNKVFSDTSLWLLLLSNVVTIFLAVKQGWNLSTVVWVYWFQSVIIGAFNFIRILQLKEFSTKGFKINGQPAAPNKGTKISTALFFLFHYGFFHVLYAIFLITGIFNEGSNTSGPEWKYILLTTLIFFGNHLFSYFYNRPKDTKKQNIGTLMFYPYARIIPIHVTIVFGFAVTGILPFFLGLKTLADAAMHIIEHQIIRKREEQ